MGRHPTPVGDWEQQEQDHMMACLEVARLNGHTDKEAEDCDNGSIGCPDCPFVSKDNPKTEVEWKLGEDHNLRPAKCCGNCDVSTPDRDKPNDCWCNHYKGPKDRIKTTDVCDLHQEK